jgi:rhodanese-related sulfurtransferase
MGIYLCVLCVLCGYAGNVSEVPAAQRKISGGYCGIYCLYAAMRSLGVKVDANELVRPEYIGSAQGSSLAELKKAAQAKGLYAAPVSCLCISDLHNLSFPFIIHVKSVPQEKTYNHYFLFLNSRQEQALIYDPPKPIERMFFYELAPLWDGTGLILSDKPINLGKIFWPARKRFLLYAITVVMIILAIRLIMRKLHPAADRLPFYKRLSLSLAEGTGLVTFALFAGLLFHFISETGFLSHANATASIQHAHLANFMPKLSTSDIQQELSAGTIFIDARDEQDYIASHIECAINIPVTLADKDRRIALSKIDKDARMVIYCQSDGCKFAEMVAAKLYSDGFSNISIYNGGWQQWQSRSKHK